jgi:hypothetical protein
LWILTWTGLGGVETEEEYDISLKNLRSWLFSFDQDLHRQNAIVLDNFLTMRIIPHKHRFFFAGRGRRMTLNQRATSALENYNQTLKVSSGKKVTPNMSMMQSIRTMDVQVEYSLSETRLTAKKVYKSRCLFARSATSNIVTKPCESQIGQQTEQAHCYGCRVLDFRSGWDGAIRLQLKRLPQYGLFCMDCKSDTDEEGKGSEKITAEFDQNKRELRLIVTSEECRKMVECAYKLEALHKPDLPSDYWAISSAISRAGAMYGLVPLADEDFGKSDAFRANPSGNGFMSQEIGLSQCEHEENGTSRNRSEALHAIAMESSDLYSTCRSVIGIVCEKARLSRTPTTESIVRKNRSVMQREVNEDLLQQQGGKQESSEFVSSHVSIDRRKKGHRLQSAGERNRRTSSSGKGVREPPRLDMDSVVPSNT